MADFRSRYEGIDLPCRPVATLLRGEMVFDGQKVAEPGTGAFVHPEIGSEACR
jgi:allantoinase